MDREERKESKPALTGDVITQKEMAAQLIFQNAEYPPRLSILNRFRHGARLEPGPLTIVQPYFDLGPFVIPVSEGPRRAEQIRQSIRDANLALDNIERAGSFTKFSQASQQITAHTWEAIQERRNASIQARNWAGFHARVRDQLYAGELTLMLWAANKCIALRFRWLSTKAFDIASTRATALGSI